MNKSVKLIISGILFLFSISLYSQRNYHDYSSSEKRVIFLDNFVDNRNNWNIINNSGESLTIKNHRFTYQSKNEKAKANYLNVDMNQNKNWEIELKIKYVKGQDNNSNGLVFGAYGRNSKRFIFAFSGNGYYNIFNFESNSFVVDWKLSNIVNRFDYNLLTVRKVSSKYYFFLNKKYVASCPYETYGKKIGIHCNSYSTIKAEFLKVSYLEKESFNYPPKIVITQPKTERGCKIVKSKSVKISGKATDKNGIYEVTINGIEANLQNNGYFFADIPLAVGDNFIKVKATDTKMKSSEKVFKINRKSDNISNNNYVTNEKRVALIIGNSNYSGQANLGNNPINDANDITLTLKSLGFNVIKKINANLNEMNNAIRQFGRQNKDADVAFFYFAGHGMQIDRINYIIPLGVNIKEENDVGFECINIATVQKIMETSNNKRLNLIVLDACRNNPFRTWKRGGDAGLSDMTPPSGTLIAFSTSPGSTSSNGNQRNGLYTGELIKQLKIPQRIEDVFINTRVEVEQKSGGKQSPWELARLRGKYYLVKD